MAILGAGAVLAGLMLGAIAVFVIDKQYSRAIVYSLIAAVLAFVGSDQRPGRPDLGSSTGVSPGSEDGLDRLCLRGHRHRRRRLAREGAAVAD